MELTGPRAPNYAFLSDFFYPLDADQTTKRITCHNKGAMSKTLIAHISYIASVQFFLGSMAGLRRFGG